MAGNKKGDVTYEIRADDSRVESDIEQANRKVEKAAKKAADDVVKTEQDKTKKLASENDKVAKDAEKTADDVADAWKDAGQDAQKAMQLDVADQSIEVDVEANTDDAEAKIKTVSRDKSIDVDVDADTTQAKKEIEDLGDTAEDTGEKIKDALGGGSGGGDGASALGNIGSVLKDSFTEAADSAIPLMGKVGDLASGLTGAQAAAIGAGAAVAGVGALAVGSANDINSAMNQLQASTGATAEETEKYRNVMEEVYNNNYGDSFGDIGQAIADINKNMGDMSEGRLKNVTESAFALRDTFGYEIPESTRAAKAMMDNFGISGDKAMNMIATGAQNGLDYSGELLDSISEYSVQFSKMGLDAEDMFAIFQKGAESGAFNLDKVGDAVKEMSIRVVDGSDTTREGFELLGLNADEMAQKFAAGGDSAKEAFEQTIDALAAMEDPLAQNQAGVDLMGTMWEDLGADAVTALADIQENSYGTADAMNQIKDVKYDDLGSQFEELKRNVETAIIPIGESLMPLLLDLGETVLPLVTGVLAPLIELFAQLLSPILSLISSAIMPLITAFISLVTSAITPLVSVLQATLLPIFTGVFSSLASTATSVIGNITNIFRSLIDFVKNVFTGNWKAAWENVKDIFSNAVSGLASIFKAPINAIVDGWNSLASSLGSVTIPDWVPVVGGGSFSLPRLSRLKSGMDYVPYDLYPALLDEGEWVLTKDEANLLRSFGGLEGMVAMLGRSGGDSMSVTVQGGTSIDYRKLGIAVADAFVRAGIGIKCDERVFGRLVKDVVNDYV